MGWWRELRLGPKLQARRAQQSGEFVLKQDDRTGETETGESGGSESSVGPDQQGVRNQRDNQTQDKNRQ
jgi:hypothetical protein